MGDIADKFGEAYRDYTTEGVPASGAYEPEKSIIRALGTAIEQAIGTAALGSVGVTKTTLSLLNADLAHPDGTTALVYADPTGTNNDLYLKSGASGTGSWTNTGILHSVSSAAAASAAQATAARDAVRPLFGSAVPTTEGVDGQCYYRISGGIVTFYGPKASGVWPSGLQLTGATGSQGIQGPPGYKAFSTWTALAAAPGSTANEAARVAFSDTGTHTDPVVGGTVSNSGEYAWSVSPAGWKRISDLSANATNFIVGPLAGGGGTSKKAVDIQAPTSGMVDSSGVNNAVTAGIAEATYLVTNGPVGRTNYYNTVVALLNNGTSAFTRDNPNMVCGSIRMESMFYSSGPGTATFKGEYHIAQSALTGSNEFRMFSASIPHLESEWPTKSIVGVNAAQFNISDGSINPRIQFDWTLNTVFIAGAGATPAPAFQFATNNQAAIRQETANGLSTIALPYVDGFDCLVNEVTTVFIGVPKASQYGTTLISGLVLSPPNNSGFITGVVAGTQPATHNAFDFTGSPTTALVHKIEAQGAGHAIYRITTGSANTAADPKLHLAVSGGQDWTVGADNSDSDRFKITKGPALGTGDQIVIDATSGPGGVGVVMLPLLTGFNYANDAAAATGGIPIGGLYHTSGAVKVRLT